MQFLPPIFLCYCIQLEASASVIGVEIVTMGPFQNVSVIIHIFSYEWQNFYNSKCFEPEIIGLLILKCSDFKMIVSNKSHMAHSFFFKEREIS